jgi:predicted RNase H-like nuclease (RuvC/YqgF family)
MGIDRHPSGKGFSAAVIRGGEVLFRRELMSVDEVAKAALDFEVDAVAVDNIYELGDEGEIRRFAGRLLRAELIQVTGFPKDGFLPLSAIGKRIGFSEGEKLNPLRSAEVCARAAAEGIGYAVKVYGPETRITISRKRRYGPGGMSSERYRRSVEGAVQSLVEGVRSALESKGMEFDLAVKKGAHGIVGASFTVYSPRNQLFGMVRQIRTSSVNVKITPLYTKSFEYMPLLQESRKEAVKRYLIVGVDPGMVTGVAVMDLDGRVLRLMSGRGMTRGQIARSLASLGRALVFASDVSPPPDMVTKLAAMHSATVFSPDRPMRTCEKSEIAGMISDEQGIVVEDSHQRDSLAAAFKAYSSFRNKLEQCASHVRLSSDQVDLEEVKALVVRGFSISDAISRSRSPAPVQPVAKKARASGERERIRVLESKFEDLRTERDALIEKIRKLSSRIEDLEEEVRLTRLEYRQPRTLDSYELERRIRSLLDETTRLRAEVDSLKSERQRLSSAIRTIAEGRSIPIRRARKIAEAVPPPEKVAGRVLIYLESVSAAEGGFEPALGAFGNLILILDEPPGAEVQSRLWEIGVPFAVRGRGDGFVVDDTLVIGRDSLENMIRAACSAMEEGMKARPDRIRALFEEYKKERMKETLRRGSLSSQELPL